MLLCDWQITQALCDHIHPFTTEQINPASYDVCVGDSVKICTQHGYVDLEFKDEAVIINPNECVLVNTSETFTLPNNIVAEFKLKSSIARHFLQSMNAGYCDPGWYGTLTMEFHNCSPRHFVLRRGMRIGQMIFYKVTSPNKPYNGKYNGQEAATVPLGEIFHKQ